jgi:phosphomannomutase / phosphoglucomutase
VSQLFGTNGVRGIVGKTMTPELALALGRAVGTWLAAGSRIAVATDARDSGPHLRDAFCAGVNASGVHTVDLGTLPSPGIQLYVRDKGFAAGAIITASHNPAEYNGIKLVAPDGTETSQEEEAQVERIVASKAYRQVAWNALGTHSRDTGAVDHYVEAVLKQVDIHAIRRAKLKVVLDPGGGAGCVTAPRLLNTLGVQTIGLSVKLDGAFKDRPSEPSPDNAARCIAAVKSSGAHLGVLQDGDADRAIFVDEKGDYVWGDQSLALAALWELRRTPKGPSDPVVCTAVSSSSCVADAVRMGGGRLEWTVVGSPVVAREMIRHDAVFGGEDNGGLMFRRHQHCRDGLMAMAFVLELLATTQRSLSDLLSEIPKYALVKEKLRVPDEAKAGILAALRGRMEREAGVRSVDARDGVKAYLDEGWVLVRPSGTEPLFRIQAEAKTAEAAAALVNRFKAVLTDCIAVAT